MASACPTCHLRDGFHDSDEPGGLHAAARARIRADLLRLPNSISKAERRAEKHAANVAWLKWVS